MAFPSPPSPTGPPCGAPPSAPPAQLGFQTGCPGLRYPLRLLVPPRVRRAWSGPGASTSPAVPGREPGLDPRVCRSRWGGDSPGRGSLETAARR